MHNEISGVEGVAPADSRIFLEVRGVHKRFAGVHALRGVNLTIERGEIYHLLGENGCPAPCWESCWWF